MPTLADLKDLGNWFVGFVVAIAFGISHIARNKARTATDLDVESAKQASVKVYVEQLLETRKLLIDERAAWAVERAELRETNERQHEQHEAEREDWRRANRELGDRFEQALAQFRDAQAVSDHDRGVLIEEVAELRGRIESMRGQIVDLQAAIQRQKSDDAEARRAVTAGYERTIASLRAENAALSDRNHDLVNQLYGDGTATGILGPKE